MAASVIRFDQVTKVFRRPDGGDLLAVDRLSLEIAKGEIVAVLGKTGCGKSTMFNLIAGLIEPTTGTVSVSGHDPFRDFEFFRGKIGIVFQGDRLMPWRTALANVLLGLEILDAEAKQAEAVARGWLERLGLGGHENDYPHALSGGMRQRVSICRALIHNPDHLLMDEPFGALDALTRDQLVLDLEALVRERRMTVLFITHSIAEAVFLSDRVIVMTPRPGGIDRIIDIKLPRPRTLAMREAPEFGEYSRQILDLFLARGVLREHRAKS